MQPAPQRDDNVFRDTRGADRSVFYERPAVDEEEQAAAEAQETMPTAPALAPDSQFVKFSEDGGGVGYTFHVDPQSVSVSGDEVRYATLIVSGAGARSIYYEGVSCPDDSYRIYAFGSADGSGFKPVRNPTWRSAREAAVTSTGGYRKDLMNRYLCASSRSRDVREIQLRLNRSGSAVRGDDEGSADGRETNIF